MKYKYALAFLASTCMLLMAFQKGGTADSWALIKTTTNLKSGNAVQYYYDSLNRVVKIQSPAGRKTMYTYLPHQVIIMREPDKSGRPNVDTFILNNDGFIEGQRYAGGLGEVHYEYNTGGFLLKLCAYFKGKMQGCSTSIVKDGNVQSFLQTDGEGKQSGAHFAYTYYDKPNTIGNYNKGLIVNGRSSRNLVKDRLSIDQKGESSTTFYTYKFDDKNRVVLEVAHTSDGTLTDSTAYTYY